TRRVQRTDDGECSAEEGRILEMQGLAAIDLYVPAIDQRDIEQGSVSCDFQRAVIRDGACFVTRRALDRRAAGQLHGVVELDGAAVGDRRARYRDAIQGQLGRSLDRHRTVVERRSAADG